MGRQLLRRCFRQRPNRIGNNTSRKKDRHLCQEMGGRAHDELAPTYNLASDGRHKDLYRNDGIHYCFEKKTTHGKGAANLMPGEHNECVGIPLLEPILSCFKLMDSGFQAEIASSAMHKALHSGGCLARQHRTPEEDDRPPASPVEPVTCRMVRRHDGSQTGIEVLIKYPWPSVTRHANVRKSPLACPLIRPTSPYRPRLVTILGRNLKLASIPKRDERGRTLDVHALRHTFGMLLSKGGVAARTAQATSRHPDIKLTMNAYTDPKLLDVAGALDALPAFPLDRGRTEREALRATGTEGGSARTLAPLLAPTADKRSESLSIAGNVSREDGSVVLAVSGVADKRKGSLTIPVSEPS